MAYAFSFATVAAYRAAKASGGAIYNALIPSSSTSGTTNVSRAAVSFIAELGRSVTDSVNLCVPYKEGGFVGDVLCYSSAYGYFWLKGESSWDSTALGQTYYDSTTFPFVRIGYCFWGQGNHGLITELSNGQGLAWNTDTSALVSGVYTSTSVPNGTRTNTWIAGVMEAAEARWGSSYYVYTWPFPRVYWNEMVAKIKAGTADSAAVAVGDSSYQVLQASDGHFYATMTVVGVNTFTSNPADYDYDFDRWYRKNVEAIIPGPSGTVTSLQKIGGLNHDGVVNTRALYATGNSPAANRAVAYAVSGAPDFGAGKWWIPTTPELIRMMKVYPKLNKYGAGFSTSYAYWTSDQCLATRAWLVGLDYGHVYHNAKTFGYQVRLVSAFNLNA